MKKKITMLLVACLPFFFYQCDNNENASNQPFEQNGAGSQQNPQTRSLDEQNSEEIHLIAEQAWEEVRQLKFSDTDFLKTKGQMSDQAIDYLTPMGWNNDFAYNQVVYLQALKRAKKHLSVENNQLVCNVKSGAEINIAEDLYKYINELFMEWNQWILAGRVEIVNVNGSYDIETKLQDVTSPMAARYAVDLTRMSHADRWSTVKELVDDCPLGDCLGSYFILNFDDYIGGEYRGNDGKLRRYSATDGCYSHGSLDPCCNYNVINHNAYISDYNMHIYSIRNNTRLAIATYQIEK